MRRGLLATGFSSNVVYAENMDQLQEYVSDVKGVLSDYKLDIQQV